MQLLNALLIFQFFFDESTRLDETFQGGAFGFAIQATVFSSSLKNRPNPLKLEKCTRKFGRDSSGGPRISSLGQREEDSAHRHFAQALK